MNIKFHYKQSRFFSRIAQWRLLPSLLLKLINENSNIFFYKEWLPLGMGSLFIPFIIYDVHAQAPVPEPVQACVIARDVPLTDAVRSRFAECLGWQSYPRTPVCMGSYQPIMISPLDDLQQIRIQADEVSLYQNQRSTLKGHVEIQQNQRIVNAQTAYIYRNPQNNQVTKIEFLKEVHYLEPDKLMIARKATINPQENSGQVEDALYRFNFEKNQESLWAWGRASLIQRFANKNYLLKKLTYTTCAPQDKAWDIKADSLEIDSENGKGVARNAVVRINEWPVLYTPYLSFPTNKERKSGFLMPLIGYSNVGGINYGMPYYWNIAPNYDLTFIPEIYTKRGVMLGGEYRYLTPNSMGVFTGNILPQDKAFNSFLKDNEFQFPLLKGISRNRWAYGIVDSTVIVPNLQFNADIQQVSDDYYLQDFTANWALATQRQLLKQADLTYSTSHWIFRGMGQSYQTLHPINETPIAPVYERVPQLMARGFYYDLPFDANLNILGQYDQFRWPKESYYGEPIEMPQGPRFHLNPILAAPLTKSWGYATPSIQFVENYYAVNNNASYLFNLGIPDFNYSSGVYKKEYNRFIPRYAVDSGLYFDRDYEINGNSFIQTLEPRLFYLNVPYFNQTPIPVYDSGFMIFNVDQLFRTNRFSGFDRIGDANQLSYALTSRWLAGDTAFERGYLSVGQIKYFRDRKVSLCQNPNGTCLDNPYTIGYLSPTASTSPIASRLGYHFNSTWGVLGDYVWNTANRATNNADLNLRYQPEPNSIINLGYSYLVNGDMTQVWNNSNENNALHQAIAAFSWPVNERWSAVGAYSHNISKNYSMMSLLGVQYDTCCWGVRVLGGRTFKNLNAYFEPSYNNNVYLQVILKGLGTVANGDPDNILSTYIPGYHRPQA